METYQWIIAALAAPAAYGGVQVFGKVDRRVKKIRNVGGKLATISQRANLLIFHAFFKAVSDGDKSGAISAGEQIIEEMSDDKIDEAMSGVFYKLLKSLLNKGDENEMKIVRIVDEHRVAIEAKQRMQLRINADNAARRQAEVPASPNGNPNALASNVDAIVADAARL